MSDQDNVIDVEAEEIVDSDNLPAVIAQPQSYQTDEPINGQERDWDTYAEPARRCVGHKKTGERCKNAAILGATVCRFHGGAAKHVKAAARARLENATDLMAKELLGMAIDPSVNDSVKLSAIKDALDRGGLRPPAEVVLTQGETKPYEELFEGIGSMSRAESRRARGVPDAQEDFAGEDQAHLQASSQEGAEHHSSRPPTGQETDDQTGPAETQLRRESLDPTTDRRQPARDRPAQRPQRHVTGEDAIRLANQANREIGALRAIESKHRRYPRP